MSLRQHLSVFGVSAMIASALAIPLGLLVYGFSEPSVFFTASFTPCVSGTVSSGNYALALPGNATGLSANKALNASTGLGGPATIDLTSEPVFSLTGQGTRDSTVGLNTAKSGFSSISPEIKALVGESVSPPRDLEQFETQYGLSPGLTLGGTGSSGRGMTTQHKEVDSLPATPPGFVEFPSKSGESLYIRADRVLYVERSGLIVKMRAQSSDSVIAYRHVAQSEAQAKQVLSQILSAL